MAIIKNQRGMTLLEVIIAIGIFLGTITMMARIQKNGIHQMKEARNQLTAKMLLQQKMEDSLIELGDKTFSDIDFNSDSEGEFGEDYPGFQWKREILPYHFNVEKAFKMLQDSDESLEDNPAFSFLAPHLDKIGEYVSDSAREVTITITWTNLSLQKKIQATTHLIKYDKTLNLMGVGL